MKLLLLLLLLTIAHAATHSVLLNWTDPSNPGGTQYNVYRATGLCSGSPAFTKLATGIAALTYTDTTVVPGNYCYYVTAVASSIESAPSNSALAPVPSFAPTMLTVMVQ